MAYTSTLPAPNETSTAKKKNKKKPPPPRSVSKMPPRTRSRWHWLVTAPTAPPPRCVSQMLSWTRSGWHWLVTAPDPIQDEQQPSNPEEDPSSAATIQRNVPKPDEAPSSAASINTPKREERRVRSDRSRKLGSADGTPAMAVAPSSRASLVTATGAAPSRKRQRSSREDGGSATTMERPARKRQSISRETGSATMDAPVIDPVGQPGIPGHDPGNAIGMDPVLPQAHNHDEILGDAVDGGNPGYGLDTDNTAGTNKCDANDGSDSNSDFGKNHDSPPDNTINPLSNLDAHANDSDAKGESEDHGKPQKLSAHQKKNAAMTPDEAVEFKKARNQRQRENRKKMLERMSPEEAVEFRKATNQRQKENRKKRLECMSPEEAVKFRKASNQRQKEYRKKRLECMSPEQLAEYRKKMNKKGKERRLKETPVETEARLSKDRIRRKEACDEKKLAAHHRRREYLERCRTNYAFALSEHYCADAKMYYQWSEERLKLAHKEMLKSMERKQIDAGSPGLEATTDDVTDTFGND